jgi:hypothetical protein
MKNKIIVAVASALLGAAAVPTTAVAGDSYGRGYDGLRYEGRHYGRDRRETFVVHYHVDGGSGRVRVDGHREAYRIEDFLESLGARAHVHEERSGHVVHFSMEGSRRIVRYSHAEAHRLARDLESYGFHAHVDHE